MDSRLLMNTTRRHTRWAALAIVITIPLLLSGCVVCPWCWDYDERPPRMAMVHVTVSDYYTGAPVTWAAVDLYEEDWWDWDYVGTWPVNPYGHTTLYGGYLYDDGDGGPEDEEFLVEVYASGYEALSYGLDLEYRHPTETLHFYLMPYYAREGEPERPEAINVEDLEEDGPNGPRVFVGEPRESLPED